MLSIEQCREILGIEIEMSDDAIAELRTQLYAIAEMALEIPSDKSQSNADVTDQR